MEEIKDAIIKDNKPNCPNCNEYKYQISDYKEIVHNGKVFVEFTVRCLECGTKFKYCSNISTEERFVLN
ncbi:UNVERIFIED_ORG: hypothetical protein B2H93_16760 [Clostridium botulinum]